MTPAIIEVSRKQWDQNYRDGCWAHLKDYTAHYAVIGSLIRKYGAESILDIGCGEGLLRQFIYDSPHYFGIDISEQAIRNAICECVTFDAETYVHGTLIDCAVFCESLYYMREPLELVERYLKMCKLVIVSVCDSGATSGLTQNLRKRFRVVEELYIAYGNHGWTVMVLSK